MSTAHNHANKGDIAKTVLMPGDPLRAKYIAETFLENPKQFNTVRNMFGYTGMFKGKEVSVMGSGIGMPSIGVYSYELFTEYEVDHIIRIGSAGSYTTDLKLGDVLIVKDAWSDSSFAKVQNLDDSEIQVPSEKLLSCCIEMAQKHEIAHTVGRIHSSDIFYVQPHAVKDWYNEYGTLAVEMESFALFSNAKVLGKHAACLLTISDNLVTHEHMSSDDREKTFTNMMKIALETAFSL
ncbi:MAG: purine-nucleoside phosphorylase [Erysipelotrichaceae bacterium]|nr:purine-nucleoside phosphorylase [Erysipelotrichaceae bacterium]